MVTNSGRSHLPKVSPLARIVSGLLLHMAKDVVMLFTQLLGVTRTSALMLGAIKIYSQQSNAPG